MGLTADSIKQTWLNKAKGLGFQMASLLLNTMYPKEFELWALALELTDSEGKTKDYFTFPIMPEEMKTSENIANTITTTFGGVSSLTSNNFIPKQISINGSFGRNLKMINRMKITVPLFGKAEWERNYGINDPVKQKEMSNMLKSGFGACKVLQSIINRSASVDPKTGNPYTLIFYNFAFGESFVVKPIEGVQFEQNIRSNAIWNYSLNLMAVCPLHLYRYGAKKLTKAYGAAALSFAMNAAVSGARDTVRASNSNSNSKFANANINI